jgi:hypothetical protein
VNNIEPPQEPGAEGPLPPAPPPPAGPPDAPGPAFAHAGALGRLLDAYRRRQARLFWLEALALGAAAAVALVLVAGLVARRWPTLGMALLVAAPVAWGGLLVVRGHLRARRRVGAADASARRVGEAAGSLGEDALSAVELSRELAASPHFSHSLASAFVADVDRRAAAVPARTLLDDRPARRAALALLAVLLAAGVALFVQGRRWVDGMAQLLGAGTDTGAQVRHEPITGDVELTYRYPAYTGLQPRTVTGTMGEVSAPPGTEVLLRSRSDRPVRRAEVVVNGAALPLEVEEERSLSGRFVVEQEGSYHFRFLGALGREAVRGQDLSITLEPDVAPKVELTLPGAEVEVHPGEKLTLRYEAQDDYGLSALELVFRTPDNKEHRRKLSLDDGRRTRGTVNWDLGAVAVKPGDRITYHVEARDNDAVAGPKKGASRTQVVRIYSAAEHRREAVRRAEALWERLISQLADRLEGGDAVEPLLPERVKGGQGVDDHGVELSSDLSREGGELSRARDAPEELAMALVSIGESYGQTVRLTRDQRRNYLRAASRGTVAAEFSRRFSGAVKAEVAELEKDILYLEALIDRRKLEELRELARELDSQKRELASLIEEYRKTQDPELRENVLQEVKELRERIAELQQRMMELARGIRDEHLNAEAMEELRNQEDMGSMLDEIEQLMREGKTDEALKKLQELSMQLDEMMQKLDQADENFGEEQNPELVKRFEEFNQALQETVAAQKDVAEETRELRDRYREKMKERLQRRGEAMREELMKKVEQAARDYANLDQSRFGAAAERSLGQLQRELDNVQNALKVDDFDLAAEAAARAERAAENLSAFGQDEVSKDEMWGNPPEVRAESRKLAEGLQKSEREVREVNQALQGLFPPAGQMMSGEDQQKLSELAGRQQKLEQRAQGLGQQMDELQQMAPIFDGEARRQMDGVGERMGEAARRMQGRDPARGHGEQQAALEQLQQFQQQMQQNRGQGQGRGLPMPMVRGNQQRGSGRGNQQQDVEIPDPDQHQAPREFRKDIMDAMKQGAPEKYRDQVKRYYEELVR